MDIQTITVVGTGTMGNGIAGQAAISGFEVVIHDINELRIKAAFDQIEKTYAKGIAKGKVSETDAEAAMNRLKSASVIEEAVTGADLIIEAVPEDMELKKKLFRVFEGAAPNHAIIASNTSSLSITEIASSITIPSRVLGMHFFNPVAVMKLVELVKGEYTSDEVMAAARKVAEKMGKTCIEVNDFPGFATSRLGIALGNEAMRMVEEGVASAQDIDTAMTLGYKTHWTTALTDLVGLDVRLAISEHLHRELARTRSCLRRFCGEW